MSNGPKCSCARCTSRGLMGPAVLITLGGVFLAGQFTRYDFGDLWPILLIVIGAIKVIEALAPAEGHTGQ